MQCEKWIVYTQVQGSKFLYIVMTPGSGATIQLVNQKRDSASPAFVVLSLTVSSGTHIGNHNKLTICSFKMSSLEV